MGFTEAIQSGFRNYVNFNGRAARSEYWYWALFVFIVSIVARAIDAAVGGFIVHFLVTLALVLPSIAVGVRRLHDRDKSGWWLLLAFVPIIGEIILIIWFVRRGTFGPNRFGPDPLKG